MDASTLPPRRGRTITILAAAAAAVLIGAGVATAEDQPPPEVDRPSGFEGEVLAPHSAFTDDVQGELEITYDGGPTLESDLWDGAETALVVRVTWQPGGTSGWHTHPGPAVVTVTEGEVEVTNAVDCVPRTYRQGEAFMDPGQGNVHIARNPSDSENATAYATFIGVPDGEPATVWVEPADC